MPAKLHSIFSFKNLLLLVVLLPLAACGGARDAEDDDELPSQPVEELYNDAKAALEGKRYKEAVEKFEAVEQQHPYSEWATRAQVMAGYANYLQEEYDSAIAILDRFTRLHPGNPSIPYAYYLVALSLLAMPASS